MCENSGTERLVLFTVGCGGTDLRWREIKSRSETSRETQERRHSDVFCPPGRRVHENIILSDTEGKKTTKRKCVNLDVCLKIQRFNVKVALEDENDILCVCVRVKGRKRTFNEEI